MDSSSELPLLSPAEARVLGCLIEKKELTPDIYPLTLNATQAAANQKTSRDPVMALEPAEIHRALGQLEQKGLVRVERYAHTVAQRFSMTSPQIVLLGLLLLRGPQTAYELLSRSERMARFQSIGDLGANLDLLIGRKPPLVQEIGRGHGQREDRYAHLLSGSVQAAVAASAPVRPMPMAASSDLEARVAALEAEVAGLRARIEALTEGR